MIMRKYLYSLATDKSKGLPAGIFKIILFILSLIYGLTVRILSFIYRIRPYRLECKVISVGNITLGGTGKTTLVEFIGRHLREQGKRIAVLSRGYARQQEQIASFGFTSKQEEHKADFKTMGDEPYMLSINLGNIPVIVDKDRIRAARRAIRDYQVDTVILDDGFQQWRIDKDLEIVTVDATNPLGNSHLLPRGILREPTSSLKRADVFILTKVNLNPDIQAIKKILTNINSHALIIEASYKPTGFYRLKESRDALIDPGEFQGRQAGLLCGIADPGSFENLISNLGIKISASFKFPDHHLYTEQDLERVISELQQKDQDMLITSEKDAVRLSNLSDKLTTIECFILRINLELLQNEIFIKRIHSLY
ncbi:MAG: tetraacyldisaccharide 4'-kinase [Candidatus Omnitrophota bacterium]|jgi:tetraacyldisaccharide 4'-kinase